MKKILILLTFWAMALAFPTPAAAALTDGLVAYYPFNGNANDESGNGNNGYNKGVYDE